MFTKIKIPNFKLVRVLVFALIIISGGLMYTPSVAAMSLNISPASTLYSISKTNVSLNNDGVYTSVILVGCLPQSGDKFDMNTGKPCTYNSKTTVIYGCAPRSGDNFDMNTGSPCLYDNKTIFMIACIPSSNDIFNIYTGLPCAKNTTYTETNKETKSITQVIKPSSGSVSNELSRNINPSTVSTEQSSNPTETAIGINKKLSGREIISNSLAASIAKLGDITKGPMSGWLILLILVIIIGGGYGIYSFNFFKKNNEGEVKETVTPSTPKVSTNTQTQSTTTPISTQGTIPLVTPNVTAHKVNSSPQDSNLVK